MLATDDVREEWTGSLVEPFLWPALENTGSTQGEVRMSGNRAERGVPVTSQEHSPVLCWRFEMSGLLTEEPSSRSTLEKHELLLHAFDLLPPRLLPHL